MKENYILNICKRRFTRKSNAFRHNSNVHDDLGTIVRDSIKLRSDKSRKKYVNKNSEIKESYFRNTMFIKKTIIQNMTSLKM